MRQLLKIILIFVVILSLVFAWKALRIARQQFTPEKTTVIPRKTYLPTPTASPVSHAALPSPAQVDNLPIAALLTPIYQHSIAFYGTILDEHKNPIEGVTVIMTLHDLSSTGTSEVRTNSDEHGSFRLEGARGRSLVVRLHKEGYNERTDLNKISFDYAYKQRDDYYSPDPSHPVLFYMQKKLSAVSLIHKDKNYKLAPIGVPLCIDLLSGHIATIARSDISITYWQDSEPNSSHEYSWHCTLLITTGGLLDRTGAFDFVAPDEGYANSYTIQMIAGTISYKKTVEKDLFFTTRNPAIFGRMHIVIVTGGDHFAYLDYYINPDGSHDLEK